MCHVSRRCFDQRLVAAVGQDRIGESSVGRIGLAAHQAAPLEAFDQV
jgi:hypothetical protein